jgi:hypothetical protein
MSIFVVLYLGVGTALSASMSFPMLSPEWQELAMGLLISGIAISIVLVVLKQVAFMFANTPMDLHADVNWTVFVIGSFWLIGYLQPFVRF